MANPVKSVDVAIIGGGAAGISAALWCDELGLDAALIEEQKELGGQLRSIYNPIENYPGITAADGREMLFRFEKSVASRKFGRRIGIKATSIDFSSMRVVLSDQGSNEATLECRSIILATGVSRRRLGIPGENEFVGNGILESGSRDKGLVSGKDVVIVGGGDAAFENASILSEFAKSVRVVFRRSEPTARREFIDKARSLANVELRPATRVTAILGDGHLRSVELEGSAGGRHTEPADAVLIRIGVTPNSELAAGKLELDEAGYVKVDNTGKTTFDRVYAVGDVANRDSPTLSTAAGTGATAVKSIFQLLVRETGYNTDPIQT